jgi:2'-5' RNA ligase
MIRSFISVPLDAALMAALEKLQRELRAGTAVRWTKPAQIHVTLKFLGDVPEDNIPALEAALRTACAGAKPFEVSLEGLGCFPNERRPSVIWVGVGKGIEPLQALQARIEAETQELTGHQEEREFKPHLTIGRVKSPNAGELQRIGQAVQSAQVGTLGAWTVSSVHLMKSELGPAGATHSELASVALA